VACRLLEETMARADEIRKLKVLLVDDRGERASALEATLSAMEGVEVACTLESPLELLARVDEHRPDIILIDTESPSRDVLEQLAAVSSTAPRPVVLFTDDAQDQAIRSALRAGVSAYIVDGLAPGRLDPIMRVAMERFETEQQLRAELEDTKARLAERKAIERAKGILVKQRRCTEEEAFVALRSLAMQRGIRLGEAAQQVIDVASLLG
jgi:two-component system, response regulator / RNA-binding antiterminator